MEIKEYVLNEKKRLKAIISSLKKVPTLVILQVNDDEASNSYIKGKKKDGEEIGANILHVKLSPSISEKELIMTIHKYNNDKKVDGIIVQMPLPKAINEENIKLLISPKKDVDGFHPLSSFLPCTPKGIIKYLKAENVVFSGKNAVVVGRSNIVGKPVANLLLKENANVVILHSYTKKEDLANYLANADIVVVAVGKKHFINSEFNLKETAVIVDVGINKENGVIYGDVEPNLRVKLQTPVPKGVGLLTRLSLLENLLEAAKNGI